MRRSSTTGGVVPNIYPTFSNQQLCVPGLDRCMCQWHQVTYSRLQSMATQGNSKTCSSTQPVRPSPLPSRFWGSTKPVYTGLEINDFDGQTFDSWTNSRLRGLIWSHLIKQKLFRFFSDAFQHFSSSPHLISPSSLSFWSSQKNQVLFGRVNIFGKFGKFGKLNYNFWSG